MRVLVTGGRGFVGQHLLADLHRAGHTVDALVGLHHEICDPKTDFVCDVRNAAEVEEHVARLKPDACIHLAGIAFVPMGWTNPNLVFDVNVQGTLNVLDAFRKQRADARILVVSSALVYGTQPRSKPIEEQDAMLPETLYAVSKIAADQTALLYAKRYGMQVMTARPSNHIGPGQSEDFVVSSFAGQLVDIAAGRHPPFIKVGNLECLRDFTDVRDIAHAYRLLIERGTAGNAYNIASGHYTRIGDVLDLLCTVTGAQPKIEIDPARYRPTDAQPEISAARIANHVGWHPEIPLGQTLSDVARWIKAKRSTSPS